MPLRTSWQGFLRLSLISVPVRAYNAAVAGGGDIHFHMIHKNCGERIRYQKVCPLHGEVNKDEIVSGYEYEKGKCVEIDPEELKKLRSDEDEAINIESFTTPDEVDVIYLSGKTFFLVPAGPPGQKPYVLLHRVMKEKKRYAIATVVLSGRDEIVLIRPLEKLLTMSVLYHHEQVKEPAAFEDEVGEGKVTAQELKLAGTLVDASTVERVDLTQHKDQYTKRISEFLEARMSGKKVTAPRHEKAPHVINLMDALRKSLVQAHGRGRSPRPGHAGNGRAHRRRKTG